MVINKTSVPVPRVKNTIGRTSLIAAISGSIILEICLHLGVLEHTFFRILAAGFEAGTVGGLADWFAVRAIFRPIPRINFRGRLWSIPHTNIIVRNRNKLVKGAVDLVTTKWLTPEAIHSKIDRANFPAIVISWLEVEKNKKSAMAIACDLGNRFAPAVSSPELAEFLERMIKNQLKGIEIEKPLGQWLEKVFQQGGHHKLWDMTLDTLQNTITDTPFKYMIQMKIEGAIEAYKEEGFWKKAGMKIGEVTGAIDPPVIAEKLITQIQEFIDEARGNPDHPARHRIDESLVAFARKLKEGDKAALEMIDTFKKKLIENAEPGEIIRGILKNVQATLVDQFQQPDSPLMRLLGQLLDKFIVELKQDTGFQKKLDIGFKNVILYFLEKNHNLIGKIVTESLSREKLDDEGLVSQIEEKVGDDLQYIRLNGAVVGGLAGVVIAAIKVIASQ